MGYLFRILEEHPRHNYFKWPLPHTPHPPPGSILAISAPGFRFYKREFEAPFLEHLSFFSSDFPLHPTWIWSTVFNILAISAPGFRFYQREFEAIFWSILATSAPVFRSTSISFTLKQFLGRLIYICSFAASFDSSFGAHVLLNISFLLLLSCSDISACCATFQAVLPLLSLRILGNHFDSFKRLQSDHALILRANGFRLICTICLLTISFKTAQFMFLNVQFIRALSWFGFHFKFNIFVCFFLRG